MKAGTGINRREFLAATLAALLGMAGLAEGAGCSSTENNPEGPFYIPGAPFRNLLAPENQPGERLRISGRVLAAPGCGPLAGAIVDVWHANAAGFYYGLEAVRPLKAEEFLLRGRIQTGENGSYTFDTILPGNYRVTETWTRPRHIHYIVSHPSRRSLTTQLYFEGEPGNKTDPMVKNSLIIPLKRRHGEKAGFEGTFDIALSA